MESWDEILGNLKIAEENWRKLLEDNRTPEQKPEILLAGPKPRTINKRAQDTEVKYEIFPLPKLKKSRGDFVNRSKKELTILNNELTYTNCAIRKGQIEEKIEDIKKNIRTYRKEKRKNNGKTPEKNK